MDTRQATIKGDIMIYKCPTCRGTHQHGADGEKPGVPTWRTSHCEKEDFKALKIIPN